MDLPTLGRPTIATKLIELTIFACFAVVAGAGLLVVFGIHVLEALDSPLLHFLVGTNIVVRKVLLSENDVEAQSENAQGYDDDTYEENFQHSLKSYDNPLIYEIRTDGLIAVNFVYYAGENLGHADYAHLGVVLQFRVGYGVGYEHLFEY